MSQIVTGDALVLDLRPARVPTRLIAALLDVLIVVVLGYLWNLLVAHLATDDSSATLFSLVGYLLIALGYVIGFETVTRGRSAGKYAVGLRVVRDDGGSIGFRQALIRGLAFWLVDFAPETAMLGGVVSSALSAQGKRIGDHLAGTIVVRTRAPRIGRALPAPEPWLADWASRLELSRVTDEQIAAARYALQRAGSMRPRYRNALLDSLARSIYQVSTPAPPPGLNPEQYLTAVLAELRRRGAAKRQLSFGVEVPVGWR